MKKIFIYLITGLIASCSLGSCSEDALETVPTGSMSGAGLFSNASSALVPLNGIYRTMYTSGWTTSGNTHQCFGISAYNLMADVMGEDMIMHDMGSGWFWYDCLYNVKSRYASTVWRPYDLWNAYYTWISNANYIIAAEETMEGTTADVNYVIGQAYAIRAYSYFMLAQSFARTYKGHEADPCCPIYTEPSAAGTDGAPRSSVGEVYAQIKNDIDKAVSLLSGISRQDAKNHINEAVACGLQARIALVMEDWSVAKAAAHQAINSSGCTILSPSDISGLNNCNLRNVMWGSEIIADQSGIFASLFMHMDKRPGNYGASAMKQINKELYNKMGEKDGRRSWWDPTDADNKSGGYQSVKIQFSDINTYLGDYIWMRVEEMYLTAAEAECRLGEEAAAIQDLMAVMSKRDTDYTCTKTGTALGHLTSDETGSLLEEIITQRRIELWGEFGRIYDIRRLKQGFRRTTAMGWPTSALLANRPTDDPECYMWVLTIPQEEFDGNINMDGTKDQNPTGDYPSGVN